MVALVGRRIHETASSSRRVQQLDPPGSFPIFTHLIVLSKQPRLMWCDRPLCLSQDRGASEDAIGNHTRIRIGIVGVKIGSLITEARHILTGLDFDGDLGKIGCVNEVFN